EAEPVAEALDVGSGSAVAERVAELVPGMIRDLGANPLDGSVLLLESTQHVVDRLAAVVSVGGTGGKEGGGEPRRAEALAQREASADVEGGLEAEEHRVGVEERHARVADVV